jgi:hypothetical protein
MGLSPRVRLQNQDIGLDSHFDARRDGNASPYVRQTATASVSHKFSQAFRSRAGDK